MDARRLKLRFGPAVLQIILAGWFLVANPLPGAEYYVSPSGDDSHPGFSERTALRTIERVNRLDLEPGDRVLFEGGQEFPGGVLITAEDAGTEHRPVVMTSYGLGRAVLQAGDGFGVRVVNAGGIEVRRLTVVGSGWQHNTNSGIIFLSDLPEIKLAHLRVDRVEVHGFGEAGIDVVGAHPSKGGFRNVRITRADVYENGHVGISARGYFSADSATWSHEQIHVANCRSFRNRGIPGRIDPSGNGIVLSDVNGAVIEFCEAFENGGLNDYPGGGPVGIWAWDAADVVIQYNESHHNRTGCPKDGGGFDLDGGVINSVIQYNYSHDNDGSGYQLVQFWAARPFSGNTVRYNVSQNDARKNEYGALHIAEAEPGQIRRSCFYNNTVYVSGTDTGTPRAVYVETTVDKVGFHNNIFLTTNGVELVKSHTTEGTLFHGNSYYSSGEDFRITWGDRVFSSLKEWRSSTGQETGTEGEVGLDLDPKLAAAGGAGTLGDPYRLPLLGQYRLQPDSPLINAGVDIDRLFGWDIGSKDYFGEPVPQSGVFDVGAHEQMDIPSL